MAPVDGFSVRAILRVRDRIGPQAALALARARAETLPPGDDRLRVLEVALESAFLAGDERSLLVIARMWPLEASRRPSTIAVTLALELRARGSTHASRTLAQAEIERAATEAAFLALAATLEDGRDLEGAVLALAPLRGASDASIARRARVEALRIALLRRSIDEALAADAVELAATSGRDLDERDALIVASASLRSSSRYDRALALDELVRIARVGDAAARIRALRVGLEHADRVSGRLSELELERLFVLVQAAQPPGAERTALERELAARRTRPGSPERLALVGGDRARRVHAVLSGGEPGPTPGPRDALDEWRALSAIAAVRAGRHAEASAALEGVTGEGSPAPAWWTVVVLAADVPLLRARIDGAVSHLIDSLTPSPRPLLEIAARLEATGHETASLAVHRAARSMGERGARDGLALALARAGWRAAGAGDHDRAIALLRQARATAR